MNYPFTRFEDEDRRRLRLLGNVLNKPGTQILAESVRLYAHQMFNGQTVDEVVEQRKKGTVFKVKTAAEQAVDYCPEVQKRLF